MSQKIGKISCRKLGILTPKKEKNRKLSLSYILLTTPMMTLFHNQMLSLVIDNHDGVHPGCTLIHMNMVIFQIFIKLKCYQNIETWQFAQTFWGLALEDNTWSSDSPTVIQDKPLITLNNLHFVQVVTFDGGEYVSMAGEFNDFRKVCL